MPVTHVLRQLTLIDGTGRPPIDEAVLAFRDGRILYAGPAPDWDGQPNGAGETLALDLPGQYALPGLIDMHVHLALNGAADGRMEGDATWATLLMLAHAQSSLAAGITTIRDVGGRFGVEFGVRRAIEAGWYVEIGRAHV